MDTIKILLGSTLALIIGALIVFAGQLKEGMANADPEKLETMSRQIAAMEREIEWMKLERERRLTQDSPSTYNPAPASNSSTQTNSAKPKPPEQVEDLKARLKRVEAEAEAAKEEVQRAEQEASFLTERHVESRNKSRRRQRIIAEALVMATISEWLENPDYGTFATLKVERPESIQVGTELALRRKNGILGKLRIKNIAPDGAIAEPITTFDEVKPQPGDELILNDVLELAQ